MPKQRLKLKQASAVLQIQPKELQNLVQFDVVKPQRSEGTYFFDANTLLVAKVAFCLKESLGTRTSVLSKLMDVFLASERNSSLRIRSTSSSSASFRQRRTLSSSECHSAHSENNFKNKWHERTCTETCPEDANAGDGRKSF